MVIADLPVTTAASVDRDITMERRIGRELLNLCFRDNHLLSLPSNSVTNVPNDPKKRRLEFIDLLRALAVASVFALHVRGYWATKIRTHGPGFILDRIFAQGAAGVDLFVVLSGFCMTYPLIRGRLTGVARISPLRFYKRRAIRLLPAYYIVLGLLVILLRVPTIQRMLVARPLTITDIVSHVFLVQPLNANTVSSINGPLWSISLEVTLYLFFPAVLIFLRHFGWSWLLMGSVGLAVGWAEGTSVLRHISVNNPWLVGTNMLLPAHFFEFALGMYAADLVCRPRPHQARFAAWLLPLGALLGAAGTIGDNDLVRTIGWGAAASALTVVASALSTGNVLRRTVRALTPLGLVSYSFYLLHQPFLLVLAGVVHSWQLPLLTLYITILPLGLATMFGLAWLFFRFAEHPFLVSGGMKDAIINDSDVVRREA